MQVLLIEKYKSKSFKVYFKIDIYKLAISVNRFTIYNSKYKRKFTFLALIKSNRAKHWVL